jgi:Ni2+-binding GTPase involved in maturation of urease and hydrogenase
MVGLATPVFRIKLLPRVLLLYSNFSVERITADMRRLAPRAEVFQVSALCGEGVAAAAQWLSRRASRGEA